MFFEIVLVGTNGRSEMHERVCATFSSTASTFGEFVQSHRPPWEVYWQDKHRLSHLGVWHWSCWIRSRCSGATIWHAQSSFFLCNSFFLFNQFCLTKHLIFSFFVFLFFQKKTPEPSTSTRSVTNYRPPVLANTSDFFESNDWQF